MRSEEDIDNLIAQTVEKFGGIDAIINNAGAIALAGVESTPLKKLDLMKIYNEQNIDDETTNLIENISSFVSTYFSELSDDRTINEWAKREITWKNLIDKIEDFNYSGNIHIVDNLINDEELISNNADADLCKSVDSDTWKAIA